MGVSRAGNTKLYCVATTDAPTVSNVPPDVLSSPQTFFTFFLFYLFFFFLGGGCLTELP